jgi:hypothetical protein
MAVAMQTIARLAKAFTAIVSRSLNDPEAAAP